MTQRLIEWITWLSQNISVELFSFVGPFIEETIAPIPSPLVMGSAGTMAQAQGKTVYYLLLLAIIAGVAKTIGSIIFYFLADKAEDLFSSKFAHLIGIDGFSAESIGKYFSNTKKDDLIIVLLRAFPLLPGTPISLFCGLVKLNLLNFTIATFIGTTLRSLLFAWLGYSGFSNYQNMLNNFDKGETIINIVIFVAVAAFLAYLFRLRQQGKLDKWLNDKFGI